MNYKLAPHLRYCQIGPASVFLDIDRGRYFVLQHDADARFRRFLEGVADGADVRWLIQQNIVGKSTAKPHQQSPIIPAPTSGIAGDELLSADIISTVKAIAAQIRARRMIRRQPLAQVLSRLSSMRQCTVPNQHQRVLDVAAAFHRARLFAPAIDQCLVRSIAMKRMLARQGCQVDLVIGVTLPFSAHAWIQSGEAILTDPLHLVESYKPILVI